MVFSSRILVILLVYCALLSSGPVFSQFASGSGSLWWKVSLWNVSTFFKQVTRELALKLAVNFRHLVQGGNFTAYWKLVDVIPVPKESSSPDVRDYRPILVTTLLSKVYENIVAGMLSYFLESNILLPPSQSSYRRGLRTCDALFTLTPHLHVALDRGTEGILVQLTSQLHLIEIVTGVYCISCGLYRCWRIDLVHSNRVL